MEFKLDTHRRQNGNIFTSLDGHKYIKSKIREEKAYLKCVLYRNGCRATAKVNLLTNLIIPATPAEFSEMLPNTIIGTFYRCTVSSNNQIAIIFFYDNIRTFLSETSTIQFDGTFYTLPIQFYQLWTVFLTVDRHTIPGIHYLMTGKGEELYKAILLI